MTIPRDPERNPRTPDLVPPLLVGVELAEDKRAAGQARRVTRDALERWRLPGLVDAVVLAVSELVTNATRHGRPPVWIGLERQREQVRLDVHDASPAELPDVSGHAAPDVESGRGLEIVQALADDLTVEQVPDDGKIVHVVFGVPRPVPDTEA